MRRVDKRALFFLGAAGLCLLILPVTPDTYRTVGIILVIAYLVLALASWLDYRSRAYGRIGGRPVPQDGNRRGNP